MDVTSTTTTHSRRAAGGPLARERIGEILGRWQPVEVRLAQGFPECRGLGREQLEDLYQETVIALLSRPYASETHLRNALRQGIRHRALNVHRDIRRRGQIIAEHAPSMHRVAEAAAAGTAPESELLRAEDRGLVLEFLGELDPFERQVFELSADGLRYRAIARRLGVDVNEARRTARAVERKRVEFRLRHELDWDPHVRARRRALALAPLPLIGCGLTAARRWLFGTGGTAKAAAVAAGAAVLVAGGIEGTDPSRHGPQPRHGNRIAAPHGEPRRPPALRRTARAGSFSGSRLAEGRSPLARSSRRAVPRVESSDGGPPALRGAGGSAVREFGIESDGGG
jgi:RNA polymerase sigma factor (sigma-70 family)